jgi:hypothetical protein
VGIGSSPTYLLDVDTNVTPTGDVVLARFSADSGVRDIGVLWDDSQSTLGFATLTSHDMVFHVGGTNHEKMRIHSSGSITTPTQPAFFTSIVAFTSDRENNYEQYTNFHEVLDRRNNFDNASDQWRFTAPTAGYYLMGVHLEINTGSVYDTTTWNYPCMMKLNNTTWLTTIDDYVADDTKHSTHTYTRIVNLAVDDYITWWSHDAGNKLVVSGDSGYGSNSYVWGYLLG